MAVALIGMFVVGPTVFQEAIPDLNPIFTGLGSVNGTAQIDASLTLYSMLGHRPTRAAFIEGGGVPLLARTLSDQDLQVASTAAVVLGHLIDAQPDARAAAVEHHALPPTLRLCTAEEDQTRMSGIYLLPRLTVHSPDTRDAAVDAGVVPLLVGHAVQGAAGAEGDGHAVFYPLEALTALMGSADARAQMLGQRLPYVVVNVLQESAALVAAAAAAVAAKALLVADPGLRPLFQDLQLEAAVMQVVRGGGPTAIHSALELIEVIVSDEEGCRRMIENSALKGLMDLIITSKHPFVLKDRAVATVVALGEAVPTKRTAQPSEGEPESRTAAEEEDDEAAWNRRKERFTPYSNKYLAWARFLGLRAAEGPAPKAAVASPGPVVPPPEQQAVEHRLALALRAVLGSDWLAARTLAAECVRDTSVTGGAQLRRVYGEVDLAVLLWRMAAERFISAAEQRAGIMALAALAMEPNVQRFFLAHAEARMEALLGMLRVQGGGTAMHLRQSAAAALTSLLAEKELRLEAVRQGGVEPLLALFLTSEEGVEVATAMAALRELARVPAARQAVLKEGGFRACAQLAQQAQGVLKENAVGLLGVLSEDGVVAREIRAQGLIPTCLELLRSTNVIERATAAEALAIIGRDVENLRVMDRLGLSALLGPAAATDAGPVRELRRFLAGVHV